MIRLPVSAGVSACESREAEHKSISYWLYSNHINAVRELRAWERDQNEAERTYLANFTWILMNSFLFFAAVFVFISFNVSPSESPHHDTSKCVVSHRRLFRDSGAPCCRKTWELGKRGISGSLSSKSRRDVLATRADVAKKDRQKRFLWPYGCVHTAIKYRDVVYDFSKGGVSNDETWSNYTLITSGMSYCTKGEVEKFNNEYSEKYGIFTNNCQTYVKKLIKFLNISSSSCSGC